MLRCKFLLQISVFGSMIEAGMENAQVTRSLLRKIYQVCHSDQAERVEEPSHRFAYCTLIGAKILRLATLAQDDRVFCVLAVGASIGAFLLQ